MRRAAARRVISGAYEHRTNPPPLPARSGFAPGAAGAGRKAAGVPGTDRALLGAARIADQPERLGHDPGAGGEGPDGALGPVREPRGAGASGRGLSRPAPAVRGPGRARRDPAAAAVVR